MPTYRLTGRLSAGELYERHAGMAEDATPVTVQLFSERASEPAVVRAISDAARQVSGGPASLVPPLGVSLLRKRVVVVSPRLTGATLQAALNRLVSRELLLQPPVALAAVLELLEALAAAHGRGAVHGALTPDAVLLDQDAGVCLSDFGLGGAATASAGFRKLLWPKAREAYRAPESAQGQAPSEAADVYAAGALAYELFTLHRPGGDKPAVSARREAPVPPSRADRRINPRFDAPLLKALEYSPQRRYRSCQEFAQALRAAASGVGGAAAASEVRKLAAELYAREADRTLGPPPWAEPFQLDLLGGEPGAPDRTEVASLPDVGLPKAEPRHDRRQVDPRSVSQDSQDTVQKDDAGWDSAPDTISTVDDAARMGVLRPIRPELPEDADDDVPGRTRPMRPKGHKAAGPKGKGFMPSRNDRSEPPPRAPDRPAAAERAPSERPSAPLASPGRPYRSPTLVVLLDSLRRRKRLLWRVSALALVVAVGAGFGIQQLRKAQRKAEMAALFAGNGSDASPREPPRPALPREIAGAREYAPPGPEGAAYLTVLTDVPAWVLIDGTRLPKTTPVFKVPVTPGEHSVVVMDATGAAQQEDLRFEAGKLQRLDVRLAAGKGAP